MTKFEETVTKIAQSPAKMRALGVAPHYLVKEAGKGEGILKKLFGGEKREGWQDMLKHVTQGLMLTGATGTGTLIAAQLQDKFLGNVDQQKSTHSEIGKLNAQNKFKAHMIESLQPMHTQVFKSMLQDDVISQADKGMITSAFATMKRFAPNLAADENAARSFLREHAIYGTGPSYASLKNLADAEQAIAKAGGALPMEMK